MDITTSTPPTALSAYRPALYRCFTRARDALFDLCDALATFPGARSFVELSQAPCFQRCWPSIYEALGDGRIDRPALHALFQATAPRPAPGARQVLALDSSPIVRPYARTAPDRTLVHVPAAGQVLPPHVAPVRPGWAFSTLVVVPAAPSSWTHILDNQRIPSDQTALTVGAAQLAALVPTCTQEAERAQDGGERGVRPLLLADGTYGAAGWVEATADLALDQLVRAASTRVLYRAAPPPTGKAGAPRKDGARFKGSDPATHGVPDAQWTGPDAHGQEVTVRCWGGLHRKECRAVPLTAVCLTRPAATNAKGDLRETWFWWLGGRPLPPLAEVARLYPRRFSIEHGYRFDKQDLLWAAPRVRTPAQMERWTDVVAAVHNEIGLARAQAQAQRLPWEDPRRPLSPRQVRRVLARIIAQEGTPAAPPRPRGKSPGRVRGAVVPRAPRHPVIRKGSARPPKRRRAA
jgi:hypothetical protein